MTPTSFPGPHGPATYGRSTTLSTEVTAGQVSESTRPASVVATFIASRKHRRRRKPKKVAGDKGYGSNPNPEWLRANGIEPVIPHKDNEKARHDPRVTFDNPTNRRRHVVEQCVGWLKECRRIGTRYEKLAVHFLGMLQLAMIAGTSNYRFQTEPKGGGGPNGSASGQSRRCAKSNKPAVIAAAPETPGSPESPRRFPCPIFRARPGLIIGG